MKFYGIELAAGSEVKNLVVERVDNLPSGLTINDKGRIVFHNSNVAIWNGASWITLVVNTGTSSVSSFNSRTGAITLGAGDLNGLIGEGNLPIASAWVRGAIKIGSGFNMNGDVLNVNAVNIPQSFPSGTRMIFLQDAAPTGWYRDGTYDNRALHIGSSLTAGGEHDAKTMNKVPHHTHTYSATTDSRNIDHTHGYTKTKVEMNGAYAQGQAKWTGAEGNSTDGMSGNQWHAHNFSGTTDGNAGHDTWRPYYVTAIACIKS